MRGQNAKSNTHVKIIFGSKYFLQKSHTYFCATKIFFLLEFLFCVVVCVFCRSLEKIHGFLLLHFQTLLGKIPMRYADYNAKNEFEQEKNFSRTEVCVWLLQKIFGSKNYFYMCVAFCVLTTHLFGFYFGLLLIVKISHYSRFSIFVDVSNPSTPKKIFCCVKMFLCLT